MGIGWRSILGATVATSVMLGGSAAQLRSTHAAAAPAPQALAYVVNGQVQVFEAGTLTTTGPGQSPVWSPNGANLLFIHADLVANAAQVFVADTHGANAHQVLSGAYPYLQPSWSPDSKSIVYAAVQGSAKSTAATVTLEIRALNPASKQTRVLGHLTVTGGCSPNGTALQAAAAAAEGSYRGTPSTLIWAQPNLVVAQSSCTGIGLTVIPIGGKSSTLSGWSSGVLSPDGKTIAAVVSNPTAHGSLQIGFLSVATRKTKVTSTAVGVTSLTWSKSGKSVIGIAESNNSVSGTAQVVQIATDAKTISYLGTIVGAGAYHPSIDRTGNSLAVAVLAHAPVKAVSLPTITVDLVGLTTTGSARPFFVGSQPTWRP